ncbi:MAG: hypothetical protein JJ938_17895 [Roseicyclus sp.]|nr:hypothetical protein [Roseicyclus sp.]MBO6626749.1 hypothetical protein [Roseicyclus sp.]MBO6922668.1 hypothetical protein [Roseicyclus sp.]
MAGTISNQIVGVCRFSYLGDGGFNASNRSREEQAELLYAPDRMRERFVFFETICLPSLAAQTDKDFTLIALVGDTMPQRWRRRLKDLMTPYPFLQVCTLEAAGPLNSTRRAFKRGWDRQSDFITGFRIDDDDAVAVDYIEKTRATADKLLEIGWCDAENPVVIAYHRGIYWDLKDVENPFYDFREIQPLGLASAMITPVETQTNIFRWNHRRLAAYARCWLDPSEQMFVRTLHAHNDSDRSIPPGAVPIPLRQARNHLWERFGLDPKRVLPVMRRLAGPRTGESAEE